jgi:glycosyltransferase involved in cell wall biosynthesis
MTLDYSVVIPAYNAAGTITAAIESVIAQTVQPKEIIVVDDGSTDETAAVLAEMRRPITILHQTNQGPGSATTAGIAQTTARYIATLDADDLWLPHKIERQAQCFEAAPETAGVFASARLFRHGDLQGNSGEGVAQRLWTRTTLLYRSDAAREIGAFIDLPGRLGETIDWLARGRDLGHVHVMLDEVLALRRIRPGSLSYSRNADSNRGYLMAVGKAWQRRKQMRAGDKPQDPA